MNNETIEIATSLGAVGGAALAGALAGMFAGMGAGLFGGLAGAAAGGVLGYWIGRRIDVPRARSAGLCEVLGAGTPRDGGRDRK